MVPVYDFKGKVALVTGAGSGMGLATARAFAANGAAVALLDIDLATIDAVAAEIRAAGGQTLAIRCDVSEETQVADAVNKVVAEFGRLDMAYNNAGIQIPPFDPADTPADEYDKVMSVNLRGIFLCMKHELKQMRAQGSGAIVNCSSVGGIVAQAGLAGYNSTKFGVLGLTKSASLNYAPLGIRINAVCPGVIDTPMVSDMIENQKEAMEFLMKLQSIGRVGRPEEVAAAVLWLCSEGASFVIGAALPVDGGFTIN